MGKNSIVLLALAGEIFTATPEMEQKWAEMPEEVRDAYAKAFAFEGEPSQNNLTEMAFAIEVERVATSQGVEVGSKTGEQWKAEIIALLQADSEELSDDKTTAPEVAPEVSVVKTSISPETVTKVQTSALQMADKMFEQNERLNNALIALIQANSETAKAVRDHVQTAIALGVTPAEEQVPALEEQVEA